MARQSLIWTTLPNGLSEDGSFLRVSVVLSPRLDAELDPPQLSSFYPDWEDWPTTLSRATFTIHYGGNTVSIPVNQTGSVNQVDTSIGTADPDTWKALFHDQLFVRGFKFRDLTSHHIVSYDTIAVDQLIRDRYRDLATQANGEMPLISSFADDPAWQSIVSAVANLDRNVGDQETGLRDPERQFNYYVRDKATGPATLTGVLGEFQAFHTPAAKPRAVVYKRQDDPRISARWLEHEKTTLSPGDAGKDIDFHQVVSALNQYPTLLRRTGLVIDFMIPAENFSHSLDAPLFTTVTFEGDAPSLQTSPDLSPVTHAQLSRRGFHAVSNPLLPADEPRIVNGMLVLDAKQFEVLQSDVDAAGLKLLNFARSIARVTPQQRRDDPVDRYEKSIGAPSLRTAGLMLVQRRRGKSLGNRFDSNLEKNLKAEAVFQAAPGVSPPQLYAEDLLRGFRFDVWDDKTRLWRSLCARLATYVLNDGEVVIGPDIEEEGTVRLATTQSADPATNSDLIYLHEAVMSWTGWGLAAAMPGRAILNDDSVDTSSDRTQAETPPAIRLKTLFEVLPKSLPRLRFGRRYWLRGRAVDLAGNSLLPRSDDFAGDDPVNHARAFLRFEPLAAPVIALFKPFEGATEAPGPGESMSRLAIRSFNDTPAHNAIATDETSRRYAVPPRSSIRDAELHGVLDSGGKVDPATFNMLAMDKDKDATQPDAVPREERIATQGPLDPSPVDTVFAVYPDGEPFTYLPDPLAEEVAVRVFRHPNIDDNTVLSIPLYTLDVWPHARAFKIRLYDDAMASPFWDEANATLQLPLPKGIRARVRLSMKLSADALSKLGIWHWLPAATQQSLSKTASNGQHWMLTPWHTVEAVHAVQRPLIAPEFIKHTVERYPDSTTARLRFQATCSLKSTNKMDVVAQWHEPIDDPSAASSEAIAADRVRGDIAFTIKITPPEAYATRLYGHPRGGIPDHSIAGVDQIGVGMPSHDLVLDKVHEFHDTRYRRIEYRLVATSSFREFMPAALLTTPTETGPEPSDENITIEGPQLVTWIPSSASPPAPEVLYVVPTFGWVRTRDTAGDEKRWRRGGGLRVYLNRPWMVSGYGEMLAVVLLPAGFSGDPENTPKGRPYKKFVTQWGNDPIWESAFVSGIGPKRSAFPKARTAPDPSGAWLPKNAPVQEKDQRPGNFQVSGLTPPGEYLHPVEIAAHDVHFDEARRLWYCDIEINQGVAYFPFIRLALARYQPTSIDSAQLSNIVLADFMPLTADRWLNVNHTRDARKRRVTVYGHRYSDSSAHQEAIHAPSMSIRVPPFSNTWKQLQPAQVSKTSVVEIWVERLSPERGEDFGWQRITGATVTEFAAGEARPSRTAETGIEARFKPAHEVAQAVVLNAQRRFATLLSESLLDRIFLVSTLWDGEVSLPALPGDDARFRLVIAEYEHYLVDDERPYDPVPESAARRLVFVEHVELTAAT